MMILIPAVLIITIVGGAVLGLFAVMVPENQAVLLFKLGGSVSNYQLQLVFDSMCEKLSGKDEKDKSQIATLVASLENYGAAVSVVGGSEAYQTPGTTPEEMMAEVSAITGMESLQNTPLFIRNDKGLVYNMPVTNQNNQRVRLLVVSPELTLAENAYSIWDSWDSIKATIKLGAVLVAGIAVVMVVITGIVLAGKLYKTIIVPLKSIQRGTREIRDGNLDCPVEVNSRDELGEVCEDFEDMRIRLKESVELKEKYENARKELIAGISHDLSTPLTAIKGYTSGLLEGVANTPEKKSHYLQTIYDTACDMEG
ncbi:MAG: HAMP domain-containing protein, partial [Eubacterium sp.]